MARAAITLEAVLETDHRNRYFAGVFLRAGEVAIVTSVKVVLLPLVSKLLEKAESGIP